MGVVRDLSNAQAPHCMGAHPQRTCIRPNGQRFSFSVWLFCQNRIISLNAMVKSPLLCLKEAIQSIIANASPPPKKKKELECLLPWLTPSSPGGGAGRPQCRLRANCDGCAYPWPAFPRVPPVSGVGRLHCRPRANCDGGAYLRTVAHSLLPTVWVSAKG